MSFARGLLVISFPQYSYHSLFLAGIAAYVYIPFCFQRKPRDLKMHVMFTSY